MDLAALSVDCRVVVSGGLVEGTSVRGGPILYLYTMTDYVVCVQVRRTRVARARNFVPRDSHVTMSRW